MQLSMGLPDGLIIGLVFKFERRSPSPAISTISSHLPPSPLTHVPQASQSCRTLISKSLSPPPGASSPTLTSLRLTRVESNPRFQKLFNQWRSSLLQLERAKPGQNTDCAIFLLHLLNKKVFPLSLGLGVSPRYTAKLFACLMFNPVLGHQQTICLSMFKLHACRASTGPTGSQINYMLICSLAR